MEVVYNKLVRDRIPEIIRADGRKAIVRTLNDSEYLHHLLIKLNEEVGEFQEDLSIEEYCDVLEVLECIISVLKFTDDDIQIVKDKKKRVNGSFRNKIFLEKVREE